MKTLLIAMLFIATSTSGCFGLISAIIASRPQTTEIPNPAVSGTVPDNIIAYDMGAAESTYDIPPGSLGREARLVSYNKDELCVLTNVRTLYLPNESRRSRNFHDPNHWTIEYSNSAETVGSVTKSDVSHKLEEIDAKLSKQTPSGSETVCVHKNKWDECEKWDTKTTYKTEYYYDKVPYGSGSAKICVKNHGIDDKTEFMRLDLVNGNDKLKFRWDFIATNQS
jgi:hypothetical protein